MPIESLCIGSDLIYVVSAHISSIGIFQEMEVMHGDVVSKFQ